MHPHLLPTFTVAMPFFRFYGNREDFAREVAGNLDDPIRWFVALARAIVHRPRLLVAILPPSSDHLPLTRPLADANEMAIFRNGQRSHFLAFADHILGSNFSPMLPP